MIPNIKQTVIEAINGEGHSQEDTRLGRQTRALNGYVIKHHYLETEKKNPRIEEKYIDDWGRMFRTMTKACNELIKDPLSRRAIVFNTTKYEKNYPCFLTMQVLTNGGKEYDMIVYQRSADVEKLEDDISFFEYVMNKMSKRTGLPITRLIIHFGSLHYQTTE